MPIPVTRPNHLQFLIDSYGLTEILELKTNESNNKIEAIIEHEDNGDSNILWEVPKHLHQNNEAFLVVFHYIFEKFEGVEVAIVPTGETSCNFSKDLRKVKEDNIAKKNKSLEGLVKKDVAKPGFTELENTKKVLEKELEGATNKTIGSDGIDVEFNAPKITTPSPINLFTTIDTLYYMGFQETIFSITIQLEAICTYARGLIKKPKN